MPHTFETQPIETERFYTGVISQRNPLAIPIRIMGRRIIELYDAILSGGDCEISVRSTLQRRAGYITYNTFELTGIPTKYYAFQPPLLGGQILPIVDTTTTTAVLQPLPNGGVTTFINKTHPTQSSFFAVGNFLYIGDQFYSSKYDGRIAQGLTNWGISLGVIPSGPNLPTSGSSIGAGQPWSNLIGVEGNTTFSTVTVPRATQSQALQAQIYGFTIPATSVVAGITVSFNLSTSGNVHNPPSLAVQLLNGGVPVGSVKTINGIQSVTLTTLGGPSDLWGTYWQPGTINPAQFGVQFIGQGGASSAIYNVNNVQITVSTIAALSVAVSATGGTFSATQGYQYVAVYGNSNDGNISNPTPVSNSTGVFTNQLNVSITLVASTDPQVNQIRVFRTTDTGTGSVFYEIPNSPFPNLNGVVIDNTPDALLIVTNAITSPSLAFSAPPAGLQLMDWYAGRMWGAVGNLLYFSAGPDNYPLGNGNSNWPPQNVYALPTTIVKLVPLTGGNGMLVVTLDKTHIVQGITNPGFTVNIWNPDLGARQQNAIDSDGSTIYIFTSDRQFLQITAAGINELSQTVSDTTDNYDPTLVYVVQHRSGSQDSRVFLSNGSTQIYPYNLMSSCWEPIQTPVDGGGVGAIGSIEIQPGLYKFLKGATTANLPILQRDQATFADAGVPYTWGATFGNIPLADPTQLANVDSITVRSTNVGVLPTLSILTNEIAATQASPFITLPNPVDEPPEDNKPAQSYRAKKYYLNKSPAWTQMSHLQIQFAFGLSSSQEEILSWGLFPNESADQQSLPAPQPQGR